MVRDLMAALNDSRRYNLPDKMLRFIRDSFDADAVSEVETQEEVARIWKETGYLADPHTAIAVKVARDHADPDVPMITLSTAHPAKFREAVERAVGVRPSLPSRVGDLFGREEAMVELGGDYESTRDFVLANAVASAD